MRGEIGGRRDWRLFREPKPLRDPATKEVLGYEAAYVGTGVDPRRLEGTGADGQRWSSFDVHCVVDSSGIVCGRSFGARTSA